MLGAPAARSPVHEGEAVAYARRITGSPDDIATQLERLFDGPPEPDADEPRIIDEPAAATAPPPPPPEVTAKPPTPPVGPADVVEELREEMDLLRNQLDVAFNEVIVKVNRIDLRLSKIRLSSDNQADVARRAEAASAQVVEIANQVLAIIDVPPSPDDPENEALEVSKEALDVSQRVLATLDAAVAVAAEPGPAPPSAPIDLDPLETRLGQLDEALTALMVESRVRIETALSQLHQQVESLRAEPVSIDTTELEDAAARGSLHNAADIAHLRRDIEALAEAVRLQDKGIGEVRTTLDWMKERLLR